MTLALVMQMSLMKSADARCPPPPQTSSVTFITATRRSLEVISMVDEQSDECLATATMALGEAPHSLRDYDDMERAVADDQAGRPSSEVDRNDRRAANARNRVAILQRSAGSPGVPWNCALSGARLPNTGSARGSIPNRYPCIVPDSTVT